MLHGFADADGRVALVAELRGDTGLLRHAGDVGHMKEAGELAGTLSYVKPG